MTDFLRDHEGIEYFPSGVCMLSMDGSERILYANREMVRIFHGTDASSFIESFRSFRGMVQPDDYIPLTALYERREGHGYAYFNFRIKTEDGHFRRLEGILAEYEDVSFGKVWLLSLINSHYKDEVMEQDSLTGLMGRHSFYRAALDMASKDKDADSFGHRVPMYVNLTNFKMYNSRYGIKAGNLLLQKMAEFLRAHFPKALIARLSADNFILLAPRDHVEQSIRELADDVRHYANDRSLSVKVGMTMYENQGSDFRRAREAFDLAKIACDSIKRDGRRVFAVYEDSMGKKLADRTYVLRNFDEALAKGYIKVYFQPVVRTLTGKVCSVEALARWEDPERGMLMPGVFVPVLEEAHLIPRLDSYVIEEAAKLYVHLKRLGRPILPVSVNLSRVDFDVMEPFRYVEAIVKKYELPRSYFRIEVTETALALDRERLKKEIGKFRRAGYQCWLDDFGSGYSSLNVLQQFRFDELKLDMVFQKESNERSRQIIRSIVMMAKTMGIHTLAEGVETKEQVDFLKDIGCEKIQGWYYSRPLPYEELKDLMLEKGLAAETPREEEIMEKAGLVNVMTELPVSLFQDDGKDTTVLYENEAFRQTMDRFIPGREAPLGRVLDCDDSPALLKFRSLVDRAIRSGREETMTYVDRSRYMKCKVRILAGARGLYTGQCEVYDMTSEDGAHSRQGLDSLVRNLFLVYDAMYLYRRESDAMEIIETRQPFLRPGGRMTREEWLGLRKYIHPGDRKRFMDFMNLDRLREAMAKSERSTAVTLFRLRKGDGSYGWQELCALALGKEGDILFCFKKTALEMTEARNEVLPLCAASYGFVVEGAEKGLKEKGCVLDAMMKSEDIKFFWKDRNRRFRGASRAFLSYYGIEKESDLIGKTDEDMGWHVDNNPYVDMERRVLKEGISSRRQRGECIIKGRLHAIEATKRPVYDGNAITGLVGYFTDLDEDGKLDDLNEKLGITDRDTGLLGYRGMLMTALAYFDNYKAHGEDYIGIALQVPAFSELVKTYGEPMGKELLHRLISIILTFCPFRETLAYLGNGRFMIFLKYAESFRVRSRLLDMANEIHHISHVAGHPVTLYLQYALAYGSESQSPDGLFHILSSRLEEAEKERYGENTYVGDRVTFDRETFDTADEGVMLAEFGSYDLLYANRKTLKDLGYPADYDYRGKKCYEFFYDRQEPCEDCPHSILRRDRFYTHLFHNPKIGRDYLIRHTLVPFGGKRCHFESAIDISHYAEKDSRKNYFLFKEAEVNDAIELGVKEADPSKGIEKMLARVGEILEAEKACIFEEMPDGTVRNTYEWCREGIPSSKHLMQHIPMKDAQPIYDRFGPDQVAIIEDIRKVMEKYGHPTWHMPGLKSLISGHLIMGGQSMGYTEIVNPSREILKEASPLLATLTRFFAIMMRNRDTVNRLNDWSYRDQLTGMKNRRAFVDFAKSLPEGSTWTFFFGDMNGLKIINDEKGHEEGDKALRAAADILAEKADREQVFRMGGDEFILALENGSPEKAEALIKSLKQSFHEKNISMALGFAIRTAPLTDIDALITEADRNMYMDKKHPRK